MEQKYCKICGSELSTKHNSIYCKKCTAYSEGKTCKKCGKLIGNSNKTGYCEKCVNYKQDKHCIHCGDPIRDKNKTGYCMKCRPKYYAIGENNPFYGKKHKKETIEKMKEKCKIATKKLWENKEYREKVINANIGKKRSDEFKEHQIINAIKQFKDPNQHKLRSERMKRSWQEGNIVATPHLSTNSSKQEKEFINFLNEKLLNDNIKVIQKHVVKYTNEKTNRKRHLFPDGYIESKNIIIEYHGSFWHADKRLFSDPEQIVHHNIKAKDVWKINDDKQKLYEKLGYHYISVWSYDFTKNFNECIDNVINEIKKY